MYDLCTKKNINNKNKRLLKYGYTKMNSKNKVNLKESWTQLTNQRFNKNTKGLYFVWQNQVKSFFVWVRGNQIPVPNKKWRIVGE